MTSLHHYVIMTSLYQSSCHGPCTHICGEPLSPPVAYQAVEAEPLATSEFVDVGCLVLQLGNVLVQQQDRHLLLPILICTQTLLVSGTVLYNDGTCIYMYIPSTQSVSSTGFCTTICLSRIFFSFRLLLCSSWSTNASTMNEITTCSTT